MYTRVKASLGGTSLDVDTFWVSWADSLPFIILDSLKNSKLILGPYLIGLGFFLGVLVVRLRPCSAWLLLFPSLF